MTEHQQQQQREVFHVKTGQIKDRNSKDLTEAEEIKKRWKEYTEDVLKKKKVLMTLITMMVRSQT